MIFGGDFIEYQNCGASGGKGWNNMAHYGWCYGFFAFKGIVMDHDEYLTKRVNAAQCRHGRRIRPFLFFPW